MGNIAVFFGGESVEHDVSVLTGLITANAVEKSGERCVAVYVDRRGNWFTGEKLKDFDTYKSFNEKGLIKVALLPGDKVLYAMKGKKIKPFCDVGSAINCMHGGYGEDGSLAGLLKMCKIPFASPSLTASGICMDKCATKIFLKGIGVDRLPYVSIKNVSELDGALKRLTFPVIVKPSTLGSSIGIKTANDEKELREAVLHALRYSDKAIIEPFVQNFDEINCAVYSDKGTVVVSECERPVKKSSVLDFEDKYICGEREFPANVSEKIKTKIQSIAKKVYVNLDCQGIIRIDFMVIDGRVFVNEINAVPGSLAYYLFTDTTEEFSEIIKIINDTAIKNFAMETTLIKNFPTSVLDIKGTKGAKRL